MRGMPGRPFAKRASERTASHHSSTTSLSSTIGWVKRARFRLRLSSTPFLVMPKVNTRQIRKRNYTYSLRFSPTMPSTDMGELLKDAPSSVSLSTSSTTIAYPLNLSSKLIDPIVDVPTPRPFDGLGPQFPVQRQKRPHPFSTSHNSRCISEGCI